MIHPREFLDWLVAGGIETFTGVPDSLLSGMIIEIDRHPEIRRHLISANEGSAVGYAIGTFVESGRPSVVYMQNSGLGNAINPLLSLAHEKIYGIPMVLIIGWRGEPGGSDEPQHMVQGAITRELLDVAGIPHVVLCNDADKSESEVSDLILSLSKKPGPVAIVVPAASFEKISPGLRSRDHHDPTTHPLLSREDALSIVVDSSPDGARMIATTGMLGRELFEIRKARGESHENDLMVVGGMGHASAVAHGVADSNVSRQVYCLDGDGSVIMHMGSLAVVGDQKPKNLKHVVFNNESHGSVGGQPTAGRSISFSELAETLGYFSVGRAENEAQLQKMAKELELSQGPAFLEVRVNGDFRKDLGRPSGGVFSPGKRIGQNLEIKSEATNGS